MPRNRQALLLGLLLLAVLLPAGLIRMQDGVTWRHSPQVQAIHREAFNSDPLRGDCLGINDVQGCDDTPGRAAAILMGDSHAESLSRALERSLPDTDAELLTWYYGDCPAIFDVHDSVLGDYGCRDFVRVAYEEASNIDPAVPLLMVSRLSYYLEGPNETRANSFKYVAEGPRPGAGRDQAELARGIVDTACAFAAHRPVYLLRPVPELKRDVPRVMGRAAMLGLEKRVSISLEEYRERHQVAWQAQDRAAEACGVTLLDPVPYLCSEGHCWGDRDGLPVYYDDDHLNERGGDLLRPLFRQMFP